MTQAIELENLLEEFGLSLSEQQFSALREWFQGMTIIGYLERARGLGERKISGYSGRPPRKGTRDSGKPLQRHRPKNAEFLQSTDAIARLLKEHEEKESTK
jgi:hypothetical protein